MRYTGVGKGDSVEVVSDTYGLLEVSWFVKFYFNTNFLFEASDISVDHFFFADGGDLEDSTGEGGVVYLDEAGLTEASKDIACHFGSVNRFELPTAEFLELLPVRQCIAIIGYLLEVMVPSGGCVSSQ